MYLFLLNWEYIHYIFYIFDKIGLKIGENITFNARKIYKLIIYNENDEKGKSN